MPGNLQDIPMSVFATWPKPNYVDPVRRTWLPAYAITWQVAATIFVAARFWLRITKRAGGLGLDDAFLLPGFIFGLMFTAMATVLVTQYGADRHTWDTPPSSFETLALGAWLSEIAFLLATSCTKISVLLFYRRLTAGTFSKRWQWAVWAALIFTGLYCFGFIFALGFNCRPVQAYWEAFNPTYTKDYTCTNTKILNPLSGVFSVVSDFYAVCLPMVMMRHFEMDRRKKLVLNAVFSLSLLVVGAGIARTYYFTQLGLSYDITWVAFDVIVWTQLEIQIALMCACAPVLRILVKEYLAEPVSRAFNTLNQTSMGRSTRADSRMTGGAGTARSVVSYTSREMSSRASRDPQDWEGNGDKKLIRHTVKPSLDTVSEHGGNTNNNDILPSSRPAGRPVPAHWPHRKPGQPVLPIPPFQQQPRQVQPHDKMVVNVEHYALSPMERKAQQPLPPLPTDQNPDMRPTLSEPFSAVDCYYEGDYDLEKQQELYELPSEKLVEYELRGTRCDHELPAKRDDYG